MASVSSARQHIEEIRRGKFSIGGEPNPLAEDLHHAVRNLSAELYTKDVHFLMELIQNAEDNEYLPGVDPSLEFVFTSKDITCTGAAATLLVFNNEVGFSRKNIESICSVGRSTKKGRRNEGFVGEKGIGFKSVFLVTSQPYIFSSNYQIKFSEEPSPECSISYIIPQWVELHPTVADIHRVYGLDKSLPNTTIVLPLKSEKVEAVRRQLSGLHPEVLLFLSKIKRVTVRESKDDHQVAESLSEISIASEKEFATRKDIDADSHIVFLSAEEGGSNSCDECNYYMWRQRFPVKREHRVDVRKDVEEWVITLAFPFGDRLKRGNSSAGVYAFLPTEMVTNFPFIIQADFLLTSSREAILLDNKWNKGILNCVSSAFVNALSSLAKSLGDAPVSSIVHMFSFLPLRESPFQELNVVREAIKTRITMEHIMPCESFTEQVIFHRPSEVARLLPAFRDILLKLKEQGLSLKGITSHGVYILHSDADLQRFDEGFRFLGIQLVDYNWYARCIQGCGLVMQAHDTYAELLYFVFDNWSNGFSTSIMRDTPILKYVNELGKVSLCSIRVAGRASTHRLCYSLDAEQNSWMNKWNLEFRCLNGLYFLPSTTAGALGKFWRINSLQSWLKQYARVECLTVSSFSDCVLTFLRGAPERNLVLSFAHFLNLSLTNNLIEAYYVTQLYSKIPVIGKHGCVFKEWRKLIVPASGSKWGNLMGTNPFCAHKYVELGEDYFCAGRFAGECVSENQLKGFMKDYLKVSDIPDLIPPDAVLPVAAASLSKEKAFLLLDWIQKLRRMSMLKDGRFLRSIKEGRWLKTSSGYSSPSLCFLADQDGDIIFSKMDSIMLNLNIIDEQFYENKIITYKEELKMIGVRQGTEGACKVIADHIKSITSSQLSKDVVISLLAFVRYLKRNGQLTEDFILTIKEGKWLKSSRGYRTPLGSVYLPLETEGLSQITCLPLVDEVFYGSQIANYKDELRMLGVVVDLSSAYPLIGTNFILPSSPTCLAKNTGTLVLNCVRNMRNNTSFINKVRKGSWLKTSLGYRSPEESILSSPEWDCLSSIVPVPIIDETFYGSMLRPFRDELEVVGVAVGFSDVTGIVVASIQKVASSFSLTATHVLSLLACLKKLEGTPYSPYQQFRKFLFDEKWLVTSHGYKSASSSILFNHEWQSISYISDLPFIDVDYYGKSIDLYTNELNRMGVIIDLSQGFQFVALGLKIPRDPDTIKPDSVLSLLQCIRSMLAKANAKTLPSGFLKKTRELRWLKTRLGYQYPYECFLYDSKFLLESGDAPFIDDHFYGSHISSYKNELKKLGVIVDIGEGCSILADKLSSHTNFMVIKRLYNYLRIHNWEPQDKNGTFIWIPNASGTIGAWVSPVSCVLSDCSHLFVSRLHVLDLYYEEPLLFFFSSAFGVKHAPLIDDYLKLWKNWESNSEGNVEYSDCCSFWNYVIQNWNLGDERRLSQCITMVPAKRASCDRVELVEKRSVFIPDDLQLKLLFEKAYPGEPLFVWNPNPSMPSIPLYKLYGYYSSIGVKAISQCVVKSADSLSIHSQLRMVTRNDSPISKGLIKLILGFLANPHHGISAERRHGIARSLIDLSVLESYDPVTISYSLLLPSQGKSLSVKDTDVFRWEKESQRLIIKQMNGNKKRDSIEFATALGKVIASGVLWDTTDLIDSLSKLIQIGYVLGFDMDAVNFLLVAENLQLFAEDEEFQSAATAFSS